MDYKVTNDLLTKLYNDFIIYEQDTITLNKTTDDKINQLLQSHKDNLPSCEMEELINLLSSVALTAQQSGFKSGVRFIINLIYSSLTH